MVVRWYVLLILMLASTVAGQSPSAVPMDREKLESAWLSAYDKKDYPAAEKALRSLIEMSPSDPIMHYNLACVLALQEKIDAGEQALKKSISLGFADFGQLLSDPTLANLSKTETFDAVRAGWRQLQDASIDDKLERFRKRLAANGQTAEKRGYRFEKDSTLRLGFASAFSDRGHRETVAELNKAAALWQSAVLPEGTLATISQGERPDPWVMVFLPIGVDYDAWAAKQFGQRGVNIGGIYNNHSNELTARDLGPTLRHEFWHALHYRHMNRLGQFHAIWVQEGLCSLVEDIEIVNDTLKPVASWRLNMAKRMLGNNLLPKLSLMMAMSEKDFTQSRVLGNYAASRTFFLWLSDTGKLRAWYGQYIVDFKTDPTGRKTTETILGKPIVKVDAEFREWIRKQPEVGEMNTPGAAVLPFDLKPSGGEGLEVESSPTTHVLKLPVLKGDIITTIDGKPVREHTEMARVLHAYKPGDEVELIVRRDGRDTKLKVKLLMYE